VLPSKHLNLSVSWVLMISAYNFVFLNQIKFIVALYNRNNQWRQLLYNSIQRTIREEHYTVILLWWQKQTLCFNLSVLVGFRGGEFRFCARKKNIAVAQKRAQSAAASVLLLYLCNVCFLTADKLIIFRCLFTYPRYGNNNTDKHNMTRSAQ